jgi:hypothetical protein
MASLRNLAITLLRLDGHTNIAPPNDPTPATPNEQPGSSPPAAKRLRPDPATPPVASAFYCSPLTSDAFERNLNPHHRSLCALRRHSVAPPTPLPNPRANQSFFQTANDPPILTASPPIRAPTSSPTQSSSLPPRSPNRLPSPPIFGESHVISYSFVSCNNPARGAPVVQNPPKSTGTGLSKQS